MKLEQRSGLTQVQKLALTPEIRQSLTILQLPLPELQSYLTRQLTENCCLESDAEEPAEFDAEADAVDLTTPESWETMLNLDGQDWDYDYQNGDPSLARPSNLNQLNVNASDLTGYFDLTLREYLLFQLHLTSLNPAAQGIMEFLIENINYDGYLDCTIEEAALVLKVDQKEADQALQLLQTFEPVGVGARSADECLTLQLQALKKTAGSAGIEILYDLALRIVANHLNAVADWRLKQIAANTEKTVAEVNEAIGLIKKLDPKPGRNFTDDLRPAAILPDASVKKAGPGYVVEVLEAAPDRLRVSPFYRRLLAQRDSLDAETINFLRANYQAALGLIKSLAQRQATLYKISAAIVEAQQEFLAKGESCLKPLTLRQIAASGRTQSVYGQPGRQWQVPGDPTRHVRL